MASRSFACQWVVFLAVFSCTPLFSAEDYLQTARERIEMRAWGDAFNFIKLELQANPRSWRAYKFLGDYHLTGLGQRKEAISAYLKAYKLAVGRDFESSGERENHYQLCDDLSRLITEKVAALPEAQATHILEQAVIDNGFASLPLAQQLLATYSKNQNWAGTSRVASAIHKIPEQNWFRRSDKDVAWLNYYDGQALEAQGDRSAAYARYILARSKGLSEVNASIARLSREMEAGTESILAQAKSAFDSGDYANAKSLYRKVSDKVPPGVPARTKANAGLNNCESAMAMDAAFQAAEAAKQNGEYRAASSRITVALAIYPTDSRLKVRFAELEKLSAEVASHITQQVDAQDQEERAKGTLRERLILEGQKLRVQGKYQEAGERFTKALRMQSDPGVEKLLKEVRRQYDIQDRYEQGINQFKKGNFAAAVKALEMVAEDDPNYREGEIRKLVALCYFELQQYEKAQVLAERCLKHQEDADLLNKMAMSLESNKDSRVDMQRAIGFLERLSKLNPSDQSIQARIAALSWELHRYQYAAGGFLALVWLCGYIFTKKRPDWSKRVNLMDLDRYMSKKNYRAAADLHSKVVKMPLTEKEELLARSNFARAFYECREYTKAISECQQVLRLLPENKQTRVLLARCLYATKNISPETLVFYLDYLETEPQNREVIVFVGTFCTKKQIINPTTMGLLRTLATLNPEDDKLRALLVKGYLKENDRSQNAMSLYQVERQRNPKNIDVRVLLAEDYLRKGDVARSIQECEEIINMELNEPRTHKILADAYAKLGKTQELAAIYQSILENDPHNGAIQGYLARLLGTSTSPAVASKRALTPEQQQALLAQGTVAGAATGAEPSTGERESAAGASADPVRGSLACPKCGKTVQVGTYFCTCGQPL